MSAGSLRVAFLGSPSVAVPALEAVSAVSHVALVVTQPDRHKGRGRHILPTPVRRRADELGAAVLPAANVNLPESLERIKAVRPDMLVVVSFGQILRKGVLEAAPLGCVNLHFSLLPALRGAAPVPWAIINDLDETGVSIMKVTPKLDAGPVYAREAERISPQDTAASLYARLAGKGARLLADSLGAIADGTLEPVPQDDTGATFAPKISRRDAAVDWNLPAADVDKRIRGLSGQLEAFAFLEREKPLRVLLFMSRPVREGGGDPGRIHRGPDGELLVGCGDGCIEIIEIQAQGRRRVSGREFANGYHLAGGERFLGGPYAASAR